MGTRLEWTKSGLTIKVETNKRPIPRVVRAYPIPPLGVSVNSLLTLALEPHPTNGQEGIRVSSSSAEGLPGWEDGTAWSLMHTAYVGTAPTVLSWETIDLGAITRLNYYLTPALLNATHRFYLVSRSRRQAVGDVETVVAYPEASITTPTQDAFTQSLLDTITTAGGASTSVGQVNSINYLAIIDQIILIRDWNNEINIKARLDSQATALSILTEKTNYDNAVAALSTNLIAAGAPANWASGGWPLGSGVFGPVTGIMTSLAGWWAAIADKRTLLQNAISVATGAIGGLTATWGSITGTLSAQTDLNTALGGKQAALGYTPVNKAGDTGVGNISMGDLSTTGVYSVGTNASVFVQGRGTGGTYLGYYSGSGGVNFGNGASTTVASISATGALTASGAVFTTVVDTFVRIESSATANAAAFVKYKRNTTGATREWWVGTGVTSTDSFDVYDFTASATRFSINSTGAATFGGAVSFPANVIHKIGTAPIFAGSGYATNYLYTGATDFQLRNAGDTSTLLTVTNAGAANFSSTVTVSGNNLYLGAGSASAESFRIWSGAGYYYLGSESSTGGALATGSTAYALTLASPATIPVQIAPAGSVSTTFASSGYVGIGTTAPNYSIEVVKAGDVAIGITATSAGSTSLNLYPTGGGLGQISVNGASHFAVRTNSAERMRIDSSGNVGVGTTAPTDFGAGSRMLTVAGTTTYGGLICASNSVTGQMFANEANGTVHIGSRTNHPLLVTINNSEKMRVDTSGNVGIGTTSPVNLLTVSGMRGNPATSGVAADGILRLVDSSSSTIVVDFGVTNAPATSAGWIQARTASSYGSNLNLLLQPNGGNVSIGNTSPGYKLDVTGTINSGTGTLSFSTSGTPTLNSSQRYLYRSTNELMWQYSDTASGAVLHLGNVSTNAATLQAAVASATAPMVGLFAARPAANFITGRTWYYYATDIEYPTSSGLYGALYTSDGATWTGPAAPSTVVGRVVAGVISAGAVGAVALSADVALIGQVIRNTGYTAGHADSLHGGSGTGAPVGFKLSGTSFTTTFSDGTTASDCYAEIGGSVNIGGRKVSTIISKIMGGYNVYTSGTSFTVPEGVTEVDLTLCGGGGGGSGAPAGSATLTSVSAGGQGGGGGGVVNMKLQVSPGDTITYSIGAGGNGGTGGQTAGASPASGNDGGNTTVTYAGRTATARGGKGGVYASASLGGDAVGMYNSVTATGAASIGAQVYQLTNGFMVAGGGVSTSASFGSDSHIGGSNGTVYGVVPSKGGGASALSDGKAGGNAGGASPSDGLAGGSAGPTDYGAGGGGGGGGTGIFAGGVGKGGSGGPGGVGCLIIRY